MTEKPKKFRIKYVLAPDLKDLHVNGVHGGITPRNEINMHLFSERAALPKSITHEIGPEGKLLPNEEWDFDSNAIRLIQCSAVMDLSTASAIRDWLSDKIDRIKEKSQKESEKDESNLA